MSQLGRVASASSRPAPATGSATSIDQCLRERRCCHLLSASFSFGGGPWETCSCCRC
jgi:hypothetical protein